MKQRSQWAIKKFHKNKAIRAVIFYPNKRMKIKWAIPNGNTVDIDKHTYSCDTKKDYFTLFNGIPTFIYNLDRVEAVNVDDIKANEDMTSGQYNTAINSKIVEDILSASDKQFAINGVVLGFVVLGIILLIGGYFLLNKINEMQNTINELSRIIKEAINPV